MMQKNWKMTETLAYGYSFEIFLPIFSRCQFLNWFANWLRFCRISNRCDSCTVVVQLSEGLATIVQQSCYWNQWKSQWNPPIYIYLLAELHDSCTTIAQQLCNCCAKALELDNYLMQAVVWLCLMWPLHAVYNKSHATPCNSTLGKISCDFWVVWLSYP